MVIIVQRYAKSPYHATIKEIFHQLERCLLAGFICIRYHKRIVRNEKISFFVADTGKVLPDN